MVTRIVRPPKDLDSFIGRKWLESITQQSVDVSGVTGLTFLLLTIDASLPNARRLLGNSDITLTDSGAGGNLTLSLGNTGVTVGTFTKVTVDAKGRVTVGANATTSDIAEGSNLYFTNARARLALSGTANQIVYDSATGVIGTPQNIDTEAIVLFHSLTLDAGASATQLVSVGGTLADFSLSAGNVGTAETDLFKTSLEADVFDKEKTKIFGQFAGTFLGHATATRQMRAYFGGAKIFDSGALLVSANSSWEIRCMVMYIGSKEFRFSTTLITENASSNLITQYAIDTTLFNTDPQDFLVTAEAAGVGAATDDIIGTFGTVEWRPVGSI